MPTVLVVSKPLSPPWSDATKNLAKEIVCHAKGTRFSILTRQGNPFGSPNAISEPIFTKENLYQPGLMQNVRIFFRLLRRDKEIDLYHFFFSPNLLTACLLRMLFKLKRKKTVHTLCSQPKQFSKKYFFADRTIGLSNDAMNQLQQLNIPSVKISPGIRIMSESEISAINISNWSFLKTRYELLVLYPGDYELDGHSVLISAMTETVKQNSKIGFIFACRVKTKVSLSIEARVKDQVKKAGLSENAVFLNEVSDMHALIKICDLIVFPVLSLHHKMDLPLVLLESMALKKPVLVSNLPSLSELVAGIEGATIQSNDSNALSSKILELSRNKAQTNEMGERGRKKVLESFNIEKVAGQYEQLYQDLLNQ